MSTLKTEHTPEPWEFFDDGRGTIIIEATEIGFRIATMAVIDPEMQQIQVSNAKLMRSAPDLLAACKASLLAVNLDLGLVDIGRIPQSEAKRLIQQREILEAAINRAEGKEVA